MRTLQVCAIALLAAVCLGAPSWDPFNIQSADGDAVQRGTLQERLRDTQKRLRRAVVTSSQRIDQVFVMDVTGSMSSYIETAKQRVIEMVNDLEHMYPDLQLRLAFVGYRDVDDTRELEMVEFVQDKEVFHDRIMSISARGGGDTNENVFSGLEAASNLDWTGTIRQVTLIADNEHNEGTGRESYVAFTPLLAEMNEQAKEAGYPLSFQVKHIGSGGEALSSKLETLLPADMSMYSEELEATDEPATTYNDSYLKGVTNQLVAAVQDFQHQEFEKYHLYEAI